MDGLNQDALNQVPSIDGIVRLPPFERPANACTFDEWAETLRGICGCFHPILGDAHEFSGWALRRRIGGLDALDAGIGVDRLERSATDVRRDGRDMYFLVVQAAGNSVVEQSSSIAHLAAGDVTLIDSDKPSTFYYAKKPAHIVSLRIPKKTIVSHLGFEPRTAALGEAGSFMTRALANLLIQVTALEREYGDNARGHFLSCAILDLIGSLFLAHADDLVPSSVQNARLYARICAIVKQRFLDPDLTSSAVAAEAGISLRYVQKLFAARGSSCSSHIQACRLDHAARLLLGRQRMTTKTTIAEIAYLSGFQDLTHFSRVFRERFKCTAGAYAEAKQ
jgi:AraC family transcriptional regulator, positive regulator of tynA and feaB